MKSRWLSERDRKQVRSGLGAALILVASIAGFILVDRLIMPLASWAVVLVIGSCLAAAMLLHRK